MAGTHNPLLPEMATVIETVQETHNIKTFRVRFDDEEKMKNFTFQPGQVGQLSVFGVGESTFVINSSPTRMDYLQFSVMKAGENTAALHKLNAGDKIGVRAPLGNWFPYDQWKGKNVFFIGGGIGMAPIRTIMVYLLDNRKDYGDISLLYGAKTPADLSFQSDMPEWLERKDLNVTLTIDNPSKLPEPAKISALYEPYVKMDIHVPNDFVGNVFKLCEEKRGIQKNMGYLTQNRVIITYELPFAEIVYDFFDRLKSGTKGYASMDYEPIDYRESNLVKLDILLNGDPVDALAVIVHKDKAYGLARGLCDKLKEIIPRQLFEVPIQGAIGNKIIARSTVKARRKDVLAKCYGGDISRKRKLLEKQKEGKKRMKAIGSVEVPQEAFMAILKVDE